MIKESIMSKVDEYEVNLVVLQNTIKRVDKLTKSGDNPVQLEIENIYLEALIGKYYRLLPLAIEENNFIGENL